MPSASWPRILPCKGCEDGLAKLGPSQLYVCRRWPGGTRGVFSYRCAGCRHTNREKLNTITAQEFQLLPPAKLADLEQAGHDTASLLQDYDLGGAFGEDHARDLFDAGLSPSQARDLVAAGFDGESLPEK